MAGFSALRGIAKAMLMQMDYVPPEALIVICNTKKQVYTCERACARNRQEMSDTSTIEKPRAREERPAQSIEKPHARARGG